MVRWSAWLGGQCGPVGQSGQVSVGQVRIVGAGQINMQWLAITRFAPSGRAVQGWGIVSTKGRDAALRDPFLVHTAAFFFFIQADGRYALELKAR